MLWSARARGCGATPWCWWCMGGAVRASSSCSTLHRNADAVWNVPGSPSPPTSRDVRVAGRFSDLVNVNAFTSIGVPRRRELDSRGCQGDARRLVGRKFRGSVSTLGVERSQPTFQGREQACQARSRSTRVSGNHFLILRCRLGHTLSLKVTPRRAAWDSKGKPRPRRTVPTTVRPVEPSTSREDAKRSGNTTECHTFAWSEILAVHLEGDRTVREQGEFGQVVPHYGAAAVDQFG